MVQKKDLTPIIYIAIMILVFMLGTSIEAKGQTLKKHLSLLHSIQLLVGVIL